MAGGREQLERLAYEARMLEQQRQIISQSMMQMQESAVQLNVAIESIKSLGKKGAKSFVPIGAGAMVPAKVDAGNVFVEVGAGVVLEMGPEAAVSILESRLKKVSNLQAVAEMDVQKAAQRLQAIDVEARGLMRKLEPSMREE